MAARRLAATLGLGVVALVLLCNGSLTHSRSQLADKLTRIESAHFALAAERAGLEPGYRKRGLGLDFQGEKPNSHFYTWMVVPTWGEGVTYFAVDRRTGEVWAYLGCEQVRSRELEALQAKFRRRFNVPASQVQRIE